MLSKKNICAVIVSYNCDDFIIKNIKSLSNQVEKILIVDNGSTKESKQILFTLQEQFKIKIIENEKNMGIAFALNQGLDFAQKQGYKLLLTLDQDSSLQSNAVLRMLDIMNENSQVISVGPNYKPFKKENANRYKYVKYLITSGNLTYVSNALYVGGYNNKLFIDGVDFDFSFKLLNQGYKLVTSEYSHMTHNLGEPVIKRILSKKIKITDHRPLRHYYMFRNNIYIFRKFFHALPIICIKKQIFISFYFWKVLILHPNKKSNIEMIIRGIKDGLQNKLGKYGE
ncbi:glycosyltransferase family 2 protein [Gracilibacillus kekensis]|uniref:Rhamnosyltransferase n=1 Tax=Gracilibacillus kekensis TaxID=1027249 RepID=A0A1M7K2K2_9BACI|nr:glycosyltransferase family 2 protein [Gracilibacillus kekensis]SHM59401.1 rhamnosyltransferase [Gracilibacillus kekensis]